MLLKSLSAFAILVALGANAQKNIRIVTARRRVLSLPAEAPTAQTDRPIEYQEPSPAPSFWDTAGRFFDQMYQGSAYDEELEEEAQPAVAPEIAQENLDDLGRKQAPQQGWSSWFGFGNKEEEENPAAYAESYQNEYGYTEQPQQSEQPRGWFGGWF